MDSIMNWCFHMGSLIAWACVFAVPIWYLTAYLISPLRQFPGPVLAGKLFTQGLWCDSGLY